MNRRKFLALLSGLVALPKIMQGLAKPDLRGEVGQMVGIPVSDAEIAAAYESLWDNQSITVPIREMTIEKLRELYPVPAMGSTYKLE